MLCANVLNLEYITALNLERKHKKLFFMVTAKTSRKWTGRMGGYGYTDIRFKEGWLLFFVDEQFKEDVLMN